VDQRPGACQGVRDVQIVTRHADPRTTMRYDRARKNLDRHPNYILAAYMASGPEQLLHS
jgi:integrase/recombinase XerD